MVKPELVHVAHVDVRVGQPITVGQTAAGLRRVVPILGGTITGPKLNGEILNAGADYQVIREDGYSVLDARYVARLDNGEMLYITNVGIRCGAPEVMAKITRGEPVDPALIYFRTAPSFETQSADHAWMLRSLFIASGARDPDMVRMDFYQVV